MKTTKTAKVEAPTGASLALLAPAGWTATYGTGSAWSWEQADDDGWEKRQATKTEAGLTWVRFDLVDGDLHVVIALNVSKPGAGKFDKWTRERAWRGRTVEGHTMYNGRSFTRHGIDCNSNLLTDLVTARAEGSHAYGDLETLLAGELTRCREAFDRSKTMVEVPGLPGGWKVTPTRREALSLSLQGGGIAEFRPHGMGTGYVVSLRKMRSWGTRLPAVTSEFFGVAGRSLYYETLDCD